MAQDEAIDATDDATQWKLWHGRERGYAAQNWQHDAAAAASSLTAVLFLGAH